MNSNIPIRSDHGRLSNQTNYHIKEKVVRMNNDKQNKKLNYLMVDIVEYSFEHFPGWALCKFRDANGKIHYIDEKIPVVSSEDIWVYNKKTILPQIGFIAGEIISKEDDLIKFSSAKYGIETKENIAVFCIHNNQIINQMEFHLFEKIKYIVDNIDKKIINDDNKSISSFNEIHNIIIDYKNAKGSQQKAYVTIHELYMLYRRQNMEEKEDFVADILDIIVGNIGNKEYLIWDEYLKT